MGLGSTQTFGWTLRCAPDKARDALLAALEQAGYEVPYNSRLEIQAKSKMAWLKNRYPADLRGTLSGGVGNETAVTWKVEAAGSKHHEVISEIAVHLPEDLLDDHGFSAAFKRLGMAGRIAGRRELASLANLIYPEEQVVELGQGHLNGKPGIVVLTTERLFFFEKSGLTKESLDQFAVDAIQALSISKKMSGERLEVAHSGMKSEITRLGPGQAQRLVDAFRDVKRRRTNPPAAVTSAPAELAKDPMEQLQRLKKLLDASLISHEEFDDKRSEILKRL